MMTLALVIPCFNEEAVLHETSMRVVAVLHRLQKAGKISAKSQIYFVDDGSIDHTWQIIESLSFRGLPVTGVKLSRNRGHQNALLAGLFTAKGDAVITIDADLQDDVDVIEQMVDEHDRGADIVYGVRNTRSSDTLFKSATARMFYGFMALLGAETIANHADFRLMSRRAIEALKQYREVNLFLRGLVPLIGFSSSCVYYNRTARFAGETKYPLRKMIALALDGITSFSVVPLRVISVVGCAVFVLSLTMSGWVLVVKLFNDEAVPGWASTLLPVYFLGGIQILCLGIIGEYLGKIYGESKARPRYIIEKMVPHRAGVTAREPVARALGATVHPLITENKISRVQ